MRRGRETVVSVVPAVPGVEREAHAMSLFVDRIHRLPRIWSNRELARIAGWFTGDVVNVSAWKDIDKEGRRYRDYFCRARSYWLTNYKTEARGFQGYDNEIYLDLEAPLPADLEGRFDVVFNHTTLEHVADMPTAFANLCRMTRDVVILVVPFLQQYHSTYGDYWRFTPLAVKYLFEKNDLEVVYQSYNNHRRASVYVFTVATRHPDRWRPRFQSWRFGVEVPRAKAAEPYIGCRALSNAAHRAASWLVRRLPRRIRPAV